MKIFNNEFFSDYTIRIDVMKQIFKNEKIYRKKSSFKLIDFIQSMFRIDVYVVVVKKIFF